MALRERGSVFMSQLQVNPEGQVKQQGTDRENKRDPAPHGLGTVKMSLGAEKKVFFAACRFPRNYGCAKEEDLDAFARGQTSSDARAIIGN